MSSGYHPQTNGQTERTNRVVEEVLRSFIDNRLSSWDELLPFVEFAINNAKSASTGYSPFFLNYGRHPMTRFSIKMPRISIPSLEQVFKSRDEALLRAKVLLRQAQDRQKTYADQKRSPLVLEPGQLVLLSSKNLRFQGKGQKKLYPKYLGPFPVKRMVNDCAAELTLPASWAIHPVFHVSLLKPYITPTDKPSNPDLHKHLPPVQNGLPVYEAEELLNDHFIKVGNKRVHEFLVKWKGFSADHNSWVSIDDLTPELVQAYVAKKARQRLVSA